MLNKRYSNYICYIMMFFSGAIQTVIGIMPPELIKQLD